MAMINTGTLVMKIDGTQYALAGDFNLNPGTPNREAVVGPDGTVASKVTPQAAQVTGSLRDRDGLDVKKLLNLQDVTVTLELENGKAWVLTNATFSIDGDISIAEGEIPVRIFAESAEEV